MVCEASAGVKCSSDSVTEKAASKYSVLIDLAKKVLGSSSSVARESQAELAGR